MCAVVIARLTGGRRSRCLVFSRIPLAIKRLNLCSTRLSDQTVASLLEFMPNLRSLEFGGNLELGERTARAISDCCPKLTCLSLRMLTGLTHVSVCSTPFVYAPPFLGACATIWVALHACACCVYSGVAYMLCVCVRLFTARYSQNCRTLPRLARPQLGLGSKPKMFRRRISFVDIVCRCSGKQLQRGSACVKRFGRRLS